MRKFSFFLIVIAFGSCSTPPSKEKNDPPTAQEIERLSSVILFGDPENGRVFDYSYRTTFRSEKNGEITFEVTVDSVFRTYDSSIVVLEPSQGPNQIYSFKTDTLLITNQYKHPQDKRAKWKVYVLIDSLEIQTPTHPFRLYSFYNLDEDKRWDETLYFSKEFGLIYSHYPFFKKKYELFNHSQIDSVTLKTLTNSLKLLSGENASMN